MEQPKNEPEEMLPRSFQNIDLGNLKNLLHISSQGGQNTFHINICDQQNIITINNQEKETGTEAISPVSYSPFFRCSKTEKTPSQLLPKSEQQSRYDHLPNLLSNRHRMLSNDKRVDSKQIENPKDAGKEVFFAQGGTVMYSESHLKFARDEKQTSEYLTPGTTFTNDLSDGATEMSKTYMLRRSTTRPISISKSINHLPSLVMAKTTPVGSISKSVEESKTWSMSQKDQVDVSNIERSDQSTKQFRRLSLSIGSLRGSRRTLPHSTTQQMKRPPANTNNKCKTKNIPEDIQSEPISVTQVKMQDSCSNKTCLESSNLLPSVQGKTKGSKTFQQWKAEKAREQKEQKEKVGKEQDSQLKKEKSQECRRSINTEVYNEWLKKKHMIELEEEKKRTIEMRNKWAAKGVSFFPQRLKLKTRVVS